MEQRDRSSFIILGQRDNGTSSKSCHGKVRAGTACQNPGRDAGRDSHYFSVKIWGGTEQLLDVLERPFSALERPFPVFLFSLESYFVPGCSGTERQAQNLAMGRDGLGQPLKILPRDGSGQPVKIRDGAGKYFLSRDKGTFRLGLSRDFASLGNPTIDRIFKSVKKVRARVSMDFTYLR